MYIQKLFKFILKCFLLFGFFVKYDFADGQNVVNSKSPSDEFGFRRNDLNDLPIRKAFPKEGEKISARWLIVAGRKVVPGSIYKVVFEAILQEQYLIQKPITVRASLVHDHHQITYAKDTVMPGEVTELLLKVPSSSVDGDWSLMVEGREGTGQLPLFKNSTKLQFDPKFLTILIQPSRPVYNAAQMMRFRVIMLTRSLKPYDEPISIYILDPKGRTIMRWPSRQTGDGVVNLSFQLPHYPSLGKWTIRVKARSQIEEKTVLVEHYFTPRFEVFVRLPPTTKEASETIDGVIVANMTNWRNVYGNLTLKLEYAIHDLKTVPDKFVNIHTEFTKHFKGVYDFSLPLQNVPSNNDISSEAGKIPEVVTVKVLAEITDAFGGEKQEGWALSRIVKESAKITFLGDQPIIFRPGMPLTLHLLASYTDSHPMPEEILSLGRATITLSMTGNTATKNEEIQIYGEKLAEDKGIIEVTFDIPEGASTLRAEASFMTTGGLSAAASVIGISHHSPHNYHIQVETSTKKAIPGEFIVLHVRNNFFIDFFNYVVVTKGVLIHSGKEPIRDVNVPTVTTFTLPASTEMAPITHILIWAVAQDGQIVSHSVAIPINPLGNHEVNVRWNEDKDHTGGSVEMKMLGETGSCFGVSAIWEETHWMDSGHELDEANILQYMLDLPQNQSQIGLTNETFPHVRKAMTRSRDGEGSNLELFATPYAGPDSPTTFRFSDLVLLTDAAVYYHPTIATEGPECNEGYHKCLTGGCYAQQERCDGIFHCNDNSDESGCPIDIDPLREFRLHRVSRIERFYDAIDGDWAWRDQRTVGGEIQVFPIPKRPQTWVVSIFGVGKTLGLGLLVEKIKFDSAGPFVLMLEGPKVARMWEQVGLRVGIFNFHNNMVGVMVTLPHSPDYRSVVVENNGVVDNYKPRTTDGDRQHLVWLAPGENRDVFIPIVFTRMGDIEVTVKGSTQMQADSHTITISVEPEGAQIGKHTSLLIDMKNRALVYKFLDIHLDETPVIPYTIDRRYIFSTPSGHISITGDVVGPAFPEVLDNDSEECLLGIEVMGAETAAYNFAAYLWSLHYLRLTNQITQDIIYKILAAVNVQYAALSRYQEDDGAFRMWLGSEKSVWLTAYVLRTLWIATFQDWENMIYIDPNIIKLGADWLVQFQGLNGAFHETSDYEHPLDPKLDQVPNYQNDDYGYRNVSLTAHVLLTLTEILPGLDSYLHTRVIQAKTRAITFLEREIQQIEDPYEVAIVAWALTKSDSQYKDYAFSKLDRLKREEGSITYWSREPIKFNPLVYEDSQKPFIQPKDDNVWDAHSVETSSYALLVYVEREGIGVIQENIVRFLTSMRELDNGLISTLDSIVAQEALVKYSYRARLRDITDMEIIIEHSADSNFSANVNLGQTMELAKMESFDINSLFGHLSVVGHGSGQAIVQLDYSYGVDHISELDYPPIDAFDFQVHSKYFGRNNSHITITACSKWINTNERPTSGLAVMEIHLPSGYFIMQDKLIDLVNTRTVRNLRWALRTDTQVKFFFNNLDTEEICVSYQLERWHPVSNHSRYNMAQVYELYQPERFNMKLFEVYPLYGLDICEVCGSFQCPYCPFYSGAVTLSISTYIQFLTSLAFIIRFFVNFYIY